MPQPINSSHKPHERSILRSAIYGGYSAYAALLLTLFVPLALIGAIGMPTLRMRRASARWVARNFLRCAGMRLKLIGAQRLPAAQCVVVANHASYLDGLVMTAVLPPRFAYVVKREMDGVPFAGLLLRRLGTEFVERFNRHKGAADARRVLRTATGGQSMVFFPEGTFGDDPGVLKFHNGAFATAVRAACPIVPVAIRGSRRVMSSRFPRLQPGLIEVIVLTPLSNEGAVQGHVEHFAVSLRDRARAMILAEVDEPDALA